MSEKELFSDDEVWNILGVTDEYLIDGFHGTEIQVCAGSWVKIAPNTWRFDADPEWSE